MQLVDFGRITTVFFNVAPEGSRKTNRVREFTKRKLLLLTLLLDKLPEVLILLIHFFAHLFSNNKWNTIV